MMFIQLLILVILLIILIVGGIVICRMADEVNQIRWDVWRMRSREDENNG